MKFADRSFLLAISAATLLMVAGCAEQGSKSQAMDWKEVPAAAQKAITKKAAGRKVEQVEKETVDGKTVYEAKVAGSGKVIKVDEKGKAVVEKKHEAAKAAAAKPAAKPAAKAAAKPAAEAAKPEATEVAWEKLPPAVQKTITKRAGKQKVEKVEEVTEKGIAMYVATIAKADGSSQTIKVSKDGKLISAKRAK